MEEAAELFSQAMEILELKGVVNAGDKVCESHRPRSGLGITAIR